MDGAKRLTDRTLTDLDQRDALVRVVTHLEDLVGVVEVLRLDPQELARLFLELADDVACGVHDGRAGGERSAATERTVGVSDGVGVADSRASSLTVTSGP